MLLLPVIVATDALHDPVFMTIPLLLLAVGTGLAQSPPASSAILAHLLDFQRTVAADHRLRTLEPREKHLRHRSNCTRLVDSGHPCGCTTVSYLRAHDHRLLRCAAGVLDDLRAASLASLPAFFRMLPLIIGGYTEGAALPGRWLDLDRPMSRRRPYCSACCTSTVNAVGQVRA